MFIISPNQQDLFMRIKKFLCPVQLARNKEGNSLLFQVRPSITFTLTALAIGRKSKLWKQLLSELETDDARSWLNWKRDLGDFLWMHSISQRLRNKLVQPLLSFCKWSRLEPREEEELSKWKSTEYLISRSALLHDPTPVTELSK